MDANTMSCWGLLLVLLFMFANQQHLTDAMVMGVCNYPVGLSRLPEHFQPVHYKLNLKLDPNDDEFSGEVQIKLKIKQETQPEDSQSHPLFNDRTKIVLNAERLKVYDAKLTQSKNKLKLDGICHDANNKILTIELNQEPNIKRLVLLTLWFKGDVHTEANGLFRSSIQSGQALATNLKPYYARRVFPCFDEPKFRSTFELTIEHPVGTIALSNMPIIDEGTSLDNLELTAFATKLRMPSYFLSLTVGKFETISKFSKDNTQIFLHAPIGFLGDGPKMLQRAIRAYEEVRNFYAFRGRTRPLKRINIVAIDMKPRTIENWGHVTIKWELLCEREDLLKPEDRNQAVTALVNVMVRFWLGNLVSVRWWDDLWFVEGLANYVTSELTRELFPEISSELYKLMDTTYSAMEDDDNLQKSHLIQGTKLKKADEIRESYNSCIYKKSEALFRMFAHFLGKDKFELAIRSFIVESTAEERTINDFWHQLAVRTDHQHISMLENVHLWWQQAGYPIISVYATKRRLIVSQESNLGHGKLWSVPFTLEIHYVVKNLKYQGKYVFTDSRTEIDLPYWFDLAGGDQWLKLNPKYEGYYRVVYKSPELVEALAGAVKSRQMPPVDRMQLLSDFYDHAKRAGSEDDFGKVLKYYSLETNDGVILMLTKLLFDSHDNEWSLALSDEVKNLMMNYYELNGRVSRMDSNVLKQCARGQVLSYLVVVFEKKEVIEDVQIYEKENGRLPPYFEHVQEYLKRLGARR